MKWNSLSSNHNSFDQQVDDALDWLRGNIPEHEYNNLLAKFPEADSRVMDGAWFDTDMMGVDQEWSSWVCDWIEANTPVYWEDGEPFYVEVDE